MYARYNSTTSITPAPSNYTDGNITVVNLPANPEMCAKLGFYPCADPAPTEGYEVDWSNSTFVLTSQSEQRTRTITEWVNGAWRTRTETYTADTSYITPTWAYKEIVPPSPDPIQAEAYSNFRSAMEVIATRYPDKIASFLAYCRQHGSIAIATWCAQNGVDADDIQLATNATMGTLHDLNNRQSFIDMLDRFEADMASEAQEESGGAE